MADLNVKDMSRGENAFIFHFSKVEKVATVSTSNFKARSCRSASTSTARVTVVFLENIFKRGQWQGNRIIPLANEVRKF